MGATIVPGATVPQRRPGWAGPQEAGVPRRRQTFHAGLLSTVRRRGHHGPWGTSHGRSERRPTWYPRAW